MQSAVKTFPTSEMNHLALRTAAFTGPRGEPVVGGTRGERLHGSPSALWHTAPTDRPLLRGVAPTTARAGPDPAQAFH